MRRLRLAHISLAILLAGSPSLSSADYHKLDARARASLARLRAHHQSIDEMRRQGVAIDARGDLDVLIRGPITREALEAAGARVRTALPGLFTASIPEAAVERVEALAGVDAIRAGAPCEPELNASVPTTGLQYLRGPGPDFVGLNGAGVLVGIVDSGVDYGHGDFDDVSGATRILDIWDQTVSGTGPPGMTYPYGKEWSPAEIDAGTAAETDTSQHGTHVAGIAAGDGSQTGGSTPAYTYAGMAPQSDIVIVKTDFATPEVVDAVNYVFDKATALGKNAVVNLSLGTHLGSHDGTSEFEQEIAALTGPGRIVVKSAGNDRGLPLHAQVNATAVGASATVSVSGSAVDRFFAVDGYYNATERLRVKVVTPNSTVIGPLLLNTENMPYPGQLTNNGNVYLVHDSLSAALKHYYLEVNVPAANKNMNGTWTVTFIADHLGAANGEVDSWRSLVAPGVTANFVLGNLPTQELITEPGNSANVITVGAWVSKTSWTGCNGIVTSFVGMPAVGNLAPFSSPGPTRDGRLKPDLAAPGTAIGSTTSFDVTQTCPSPPTASPLLNDGMNHQVMQGTSLSAPHVTGAVALLLQKWGAATPAQIKSYLQTHALADAFTGGVPTNNWGYGKLYLGDLIDPAVHVVFLNGGETRYVGQTVTLRWTASDSLGSVASVDLQLSRSGTGGPFESIASGIANSGSYGWTITGPPTGTNTAYLRVLAHDTNSNVGSDLSDAGFTIKSALPVDEGLPKSFALAVSPNPTPAGAAVEFSVPRSSRIRIAVDDVQGRTVATLAEGPYPPGRHHLSWNGMRAGAPVAAGLYFVRYDTPEGRIVRRLAVTR